MRTQEFINEFLHSRAATDVSPVTIDWYRVKLQRFALSCPELPDGPEPIEAFLAGLNSSPVTKQNYLAAFRAFFSFISERHGTCNPINKVTRSRSLKRRLMATLEPDEAMRLLHSTSTLRDKAILTLFIDTGMRTGELAGLRKQDIRANTVTVYGKCGQREIPISEETKRLLLLIIAQDGKDEYVFHGHKGPLTRHGVYRIVSEYMHKAGIKGPKLGAHRIRHAFGRSYLVNGGDVRSLQEIMGHASISTTQKYASLNLNDTIAKHRQFTPLRSAHAAAQESFFEPLEAVREAEAIVARR